MLTPKLCTAINDESIRIMVSLPNKGRTSISVLSVMCDNVSTGVVGEGITFYCHYSTKGYLMVFEAVTTLYIFKYIF